MAQEKVFVAWHHWGSIVIRGSSGDIKFLTVKEVNKDANVLTECVPVLQTALNGVPVHRLAFVHNAIGGVARQAFEETLHNAGFEHVSMVHWITNDVQLMLSRIDQKLLQKENTYSFATKESVQIRTLTNENTLRFEAMLRVKEKSFAQSLRLLIQRHRIRRCFCYQSPRAVETLQKEFANELSLTVLGKETAPSMVAETALTRLLAAEGKVEVPLVLNYNWCGPQVIVNGTKLLNQHDDCLSLPFHWTSEWLAVGNKVEIRFDGIVREMDLTESSRVSVTIDDDGTLQTSVQQKRVLGIHLTEDSVSVALPANGDGTASSIFTLSTVVDFETKQPVVLRPHDARSQFVVEDAIKMLDPESPPQEGWVKLRLTTDSAEYYRVLRQQELISATTVVSHIFQTIASLIHERVKGFDGECRLLVPAAFTDRQRQQLQKAAHDVDLQIRLQDDALPRASLIAAGTMQTWSDVRVQGDKVVVLDVCNRCIRGSVFEWNSHTVELVAESTNCTVKSELLRQHQRNWLERVQNDTKNVAATYCASHVAEPLLEDLRTFVHKLVPRQELYRVRSVLLLGDFRLIALVHNLFLWTFLNATVQTLSDDEIGSLSAAGVLLFSNKGKSE